MKILSIPLISLALAGCASTDYRSRMLERETDWANRASLTKEPSEALSGVTGAPAQEPRAVSTSRDATLNDYVDQAIRNNAGLHAAFDRWTAAMEKIPQTTSLPDPQFTWTYFVEEVQTRTGPQNNRFSLSQRFPWFGKLKLQGEASALAAESVWWELEAKKLKVIRDVKNAYYEYAYLGKAIQIVEENLTLLKSLEPVVQRAIQVGGGQSDLVRLQVEIGKLENDVETLKSFRLPISSRLRAIMNSETVGSLPWPALPTDSAASYGRDELVNRFNKLNPELQALVQRIDQARVLTKRARLQSYPDFSLGVTYIETGSSVTTMTPSDSGEDPWGFTVGISLPIWRQKYKAGVREAISNQSNADRLLRQKRFDLIAEIDLRAYELDDAARQIGLYQATLIPRAEQALEITEISYESGSASLLDVIDSQRELLAFEKAYWRFVATHKQLVADLEMVTGGPLE